MGARSADAAPPRYRPLYALADGDDSWHARVRDFLAGERAPFLVPVSVLPEAAYLIRTPLGERAGRLKLDAVVTTDRRDFRRVKPKHVAAFQLLP